MNVASHNLAAVITVVEIPVHVAQRGSRLCVLVLILHITVRGPGNVLGQSLRLG